MLVPRMAPSTVKRMHCIYYVWHACLCCTAMKPIVISKLYIIYALKKSRISVILGIYWN
jgi:hypothetical protein